LRSRSREGWFQSRPNSIEDQFKVFKNKSIFKSNDPYVKSSQKFSSCFVGFGANPIHVVCAVQFNGNSEFRTIKVDNVRTYAVLSPEFLSIELPPLEVFP